MTDPVTLTALGSWAASEGIKFLDGQAAELLKADPSGKARRPVQE